MDKRGGIRWVVRHPWRSLLVVICCAWLIDHAGRPVWMRPPGADDSTPLRAFINPNGDLSDNPNQSIGTLRYFRAMESCDERLLATDLHEWRHLQVTIKGDALAANDAEQWRWRAAKHFRSPIILLGEFDGVRRLWLGYPGEWLLLLLLGTGLICGCWLAFLALRAVIEFFVFQFDPDVRRRAALGKQLCPQCGYDIRNLPECRCPECGATWKQDELVDHPMLDE